jgi:hypothetical protein
MVRYFDDSFEVYKLNYCFHVLLCTSMLFVLLVAYVCVILVFLVYVSN